MQWNTIEKSNVCLYYVKWECLKVDVDKIDKLNAFQSLIFISGNWVRKILGLNWNYV